MLINDRERERVRGREGFFVFVFAREDATIKHQTHKCTQQRHRAYLFPSVPLGCCKKKKAKEPLNRASTGRRATPYACRVMASSPAYGKEGWNKQHDEKSKGSEQTSEMAFKTFLHTQSTNESLIAFAHHCNLNSLLAV